MTVRVTEIGVEHGRVVSARATFPPDAIDDGDPIPDTAWVVEYDAEGRVSAESVDERADRSFEFRIVYRYSCN